MSRPGICCAALAHSASTPADVRALMLPVAIAATARDQSDHAALGTWYMSDQLWQWRCSAQSLLPNANSLSSAASAALREASWPSVHQSQRLCDAGPSLALHDFAASKEDTSPSHSRQKRPSRSLTARQSHPAFKFWASPRKAGVSQNSAWSARAPFGAPEVIKRFIHAGTALPAFVPVTRWLSASPTHG